MGNLEDKLKSAVLASALTEDRKASDKRTKAVVRWAAMSFSAAAMAFLLQIPWGPKDTFDDPAAAYAELERTFAYISQKIDKGAEIAAKAEEPVETIKNIFE